MEVQGSRSYSVPHSKQAKEGEREREREGRERQRERKREGGGSTQHAQSMHENQKIREVFWGGSALPIWVLGTELQSLGL